MKPLKARFSLLILSVIAISIVSCIKDDDFDFDKIASGSWSPDLAAPLIHSSLGISDIISIGDSDGFSVDTNHLVRLIYRGNIYSISGEALLPVVDQADNTNFNINSGDSASLYSNNSVSVPVSKTLPFIFPSGEQIDSMNIKTGQLELTITSTVPHPGTMNVSIPALTNNGTALNFSVPFNASSGPQVITIDSTSLRGYLFDLTTITGMPGWFTINYTANYSNSNSSLSVTNKSFQLSARFKDIHFYSIFGDLGSKVISLDQDSSQITLFDNFQSGSIFFDDPKMTFTLTNSFGMPLDAHVVSLAGLTDNGTPMPLTGSIPDPLPVGYPTQLGQSSSGSFTLDRNNSNLHSVIGSNPRYFVYTINATSNSPAAPNNFLTDSSQFKADIQMDFPLRGFVSGFTIQDTVDFALDKIDEIESAVFRINADNGFPISAFTQIYFTDSNYVVLDSMITDPTQNIIESAEVDNNGKVSHSTRKTSDQPFTNQRLQNLFAAKKLLIVSTLETKDAPNTMIEIYDTYKLDVKIGIRTRLKFGF